MTSYNRRLKRCGEFLRQSAADPDASSIICVLDALDECREDDRKQLIKWLCDIRQSLAHHDSKSTIKFLVTSRPYDNVQRWFEPTTLRWPYVRLRGEDENDQIHREINLVIEQRIRDLTSEFALSNSNTDRLREQLLQMQHRTYLWLYLAIEEIRGLYQNSFHPNNVVIPTLSSSVEDAYERILQKIEMQQKPNARRILLIIVGARRALTIGEMALALGAASVHQLDDSTFEAPDERHLKKHIRQWCGLFVFIQDSKLFLIHQTAKEYLLSKNLHASFDARNWRSSLTLTEVEVEMANLCTMYLCMTNTDDEFRTLQEHRSQTQKAGETFFTYCAEYWGSHLQDQDITNDHNDHRLLKRVLKLYIVSSNLFRSWFFRAWQAYRPWESAPDVLSQHVIAFNGHTAILAYCYRMYGFDLEARDEDRRTALFWAAERGHESVAEWLLSRGADANTRGTRSTVLHTASENGHGKVVQILLDHGADVNARGTFGTALHSASIYGHEKVVQIFRAARAKVKV